MAEGEIPRPRQQPIDLSKLDFAIFNSYFTHRLIDGRHLTDDTFSQWDREEGIQEEDDQESDSDDHNGRVKHSWNEEYDPQCSSAVRMLKNRGALFLHDDVDGEGLTVLQECEDQEALLNVVPGGGVIAFRCANMGQAINIHHCLVKADYCGHMEYIDGISGYKLPNGKSVVVFDYDTESG